MSMIRERRASDLRLLGIISALAIVAIGGFLVWSAQTIGFGYPLDDSWIHQTFARNLGQYGQWAFLPGRTSAGSTAPLWSALLSLGYVFHLPPLLWSTLLGGLSLIAIAFICYRWLLIRAPNSSSWIRAFVVLFVFEWHLVWAALSGMETIMVALIAVTLLMLLDQWDVPGWWFGALIGIGVWIRPDSVLLWVPLIFVWTIRESMNPRKLLIDLGRVLAAFALIILPYLLMNWSISGQIWPSTYYAKQAEYAELKEIPFLFRYLHQWRAPLAGLGILLLPGVIWITIRDIRAGKWVRLAPILWVCLYLAAYAFSLPVDYHHGRYSMPVIPVLLVLGLEGMGLLEARRQEGGWIWLASSVWRVSAVVIVFTFWLIGARTYASDVAIIETEMVQMAKWINSETSEAAVIATHDIGAMGYFGDRELIDLAGLVSPEIIPIIRDEAAIERFLEERKPEYLMTFPVWYPDLIASREVVHCTQGEYNPVVGGVHMCLFKW